MGSLLAHARIFVEGSATRRSAARADRRVFRVFAGAALVAFALFVTCAVAPGVAQASVPAQPARVAHMEHDGTSAAALGAARCVEEEGAPPARELPASAPEGSQDHAELGAFVARTSPPARPRLPRATRHLRPASARWTAPPSLSATQPRGPPPGA